MAEVLFTSAWIRITDEAVETRGKSFPLRDVQALEKTGFWGARVAFVCATVGIVIIAGAVSTGPLAHNAMFYLFIVTWLALLAMLGYAAIALRGVRVRLPDRGVSLPGRFTAKELAAVQAAFLRAKAAL